jgi:hypothetical protein
MIRLPVIAMTFVLALPASAQSLSADALAKQSQAIAIRVQSQLMECWSVPEGETDQRLALDIVFFGDGTLDGEAEFPLAARKLASKRPALAESVLAAVKACLPFEGLTELGAGPRERFSVTIYFQS